MRAKLDSTFPLSVSLGPDYQWLGIRPLVGLIMLLAFDPKNPSS